MCRPPSGTSPGRRRRQPSGPDRTGHANLPRRQRPEQRASRAIALQERPTLGVSKGSPPLLRAPQPISPAPYVILNTCIISGDKFGVFTAALRARTFFGESSAVESRVVGGNDSIRFRIRCLGGSEPGWSGTGRKRIKGPLCGANLAVYRAQRMDKAGPVLPLSACRISAFLTKGKPFRGVSATFVSFQQQDRRKRLREPASEEVPDCMPPALLYFHSRKRGGGSSVFWQSTGMGQGTLSFSKRTQTHTKL